MKNYAIIVLVILSLCSCSQSGAKKAQSTDNMKAELIGQNWGGLAAGTSFSYGGKEITVTNDLGSIEVSLRIKNTSSKQVVVPKWILLDKNDHEFKKASGSFSLLDNELKGFIDEGVIITPNESKLIHLRSPANFLPYLRQREPLYIADSERKFKWLLSSIPDPHVLFKDAIEKGCNHSLELTLEDQQWKNIPKGSKIGHSKGKFDLNEDMMVANLSVKVLNTAKNSVVIPPLFLIDNTKAPVTKFIIEDDEGASKEGVKLPSGERIIIKLTMPMEPYDKLVGLEPLYISDQNLSWPLELVSIKKNREK